MRNDNHGHFFLGQLADNLQHFNGKLRIQRRCRLVKKQNLRFHGKRPGNCHSLLLSAGKLTGIGIRLIFKAHLAKDFPCLFFHFLPVSF